MTRAFRVSVEVPGMRASFRPRYYATREAAERGAQPARHYIRSTINRYSRSHFPYGRVVVEEYAGNRWSRIDVARVEHSGDPA